jgi:hypothetical protein
MPHPSQLKSCGWGVLQQPTATLNLWEEQGDGRAVVYPWTRGPGSFGHARMARKLTGVLQPGLASSSLPCPLVMMEGNEIHHCDIRILWAEDIWESINAGRRLILNCSYLPEGKPSPKEFRCHKLLPKAWEFLNQGRLAAVTRLEE